MKIGRDDTRIDVGRDPQGRIVVDVMGPATMRCRDAEIWLVMQTLRVRREMAAGATQFVFPLSMRLALTEVSQAEHLADEFYMHAGDDKTNDLVYATDSWQAAIDDLLNNPKKEN